MQGPQGPRGFAGYPGPTGQKGNPGLTGKRGLAGSKGKRGQIGFSGESGQNGPRVSQNMWNVSEASAGYSQAASRPSSTSAFFLLIFMLAECNS